MKSRDYEHPLDREALKMLKKTRGVEKLVRKFHEYGYDKFLKVRYTGSYIKVNKKMFPELHELLNKSCKRINLKKEPALYIEQSPIINAFTCGVENPIIVLSSGCLDLLSEDELIFILGHELGHIKSEHVLYYQIAEGLPILGEIVSNATLGLGGLVSTSLQYALLNWRRKSEFTADRAGFLNCQNKDAVIIAMMKIAGVPPEYYDRIDPDSFIQQAEEFEEYEEEQINKIAKKLSIFGKTHPWSVMRAAKINNWYESGNYKVVLNKEKYLNFCPSCGQKLRSEVNFCTQCGKAL